MHLFVHPSLFPFIHSFIHISILFILPIFHSFICPFIHISIMFILPIFSFFHMSFHSYIHLVHQFFFFHMFMKIKNIPLGITEGSVLKRRSRQSAADCLTTSSVSLNNTNILSKHTLKLLKSE